MDDPGDLHGCRYDSELFDQALAELEYFPELQELISVDRHGVNYGNMERHDHHDGDILCEPSFMDHNLITDVQAQETFVNGHAVRPMITTEQSPYGPHYNNGLHYTQDQSATVSPIAVEQHTYSPYANTGFGLTATDAQSFPTSPIDAYNNIFLTPPQGQDLAFDPGYMPQKTPSLDSGTTYATQQGLGGSNVLLDFEQDFPYMAGLSPSNIGNLSSTLSPNRPRSSSAGSKRPSVDLGDTEARPKRAKNVKGGYPCEHSTCDKRFNRACDERKHYTNVHAEKMHACELCKSRFSYPKDVRRHMDQVHNIFVPKPQDEKKSRSRFTSMSSVVALLAKLRLWHKDQADEAVDQIPEQYILVTRDQREYRKICLKGLETSEALMREIGRAFEIQLGHVDDALLRRCGGGTVGKRIVGKQLMAAARKAVAANHTLELLFTPKDGVAKVC